MSLSPILKVLSSMQTHQVQCLLMGGQACVLYGAAQFSRDTDLAIVGDDANLKRLQAALDELQASPVAVPPFERVYLEKGLAVHFRCRAVDVEGMRNDVMSKMRGVSDFPTLWSRRTTIEYQGATIDLLALSDLVAAKKTQCDKDWPMIARLVEGHYFANRDNPLPEHVDFWLAELRTSSLLCDVASRFADECEASAASRPLLQRALANDIAATDTALADEQAAERAKDAAYWAPLKKELEQLRHAKRKR